MLNNSQEKNYQESEKTVPEGDIFAIDSSEVENLKVRIEHLESQLKKERPFVAKKRKKQ